VDGPRITLERYVYISDGERFAPLFKVVVGGRNIYLVNPSTPGSGHISYHESGAFNLGQPGHSPPVLYHWLGSIDGIHGYQYLTRRMHNAHGFSSLLTGSDSDGPSNRRPGPVVDVRSQPANTRFLEIELGVRCPRECHASDDSFFSKRRFLREETSVGTRLLVLSATWVPLFGLA
jgi:hypothetical protein